jgi:hypothetical protein
MICTNGLMVYSYALPPNEWDFRRIREDEFRVAALYEYARSSEVVTAVWKAWLQRDVEVSQSQSKVTRLCVHQLLKGASPDLGNEPAKTRVDDALLASFPGILRWFGLEEVLLTIRGLEKPWLDLDKEVRKRALSLPLDTPPTRSFCDAITTPGLNLTNFAVTVDMTASSTELDRDFRWWVAQKRKTLNIPATSAQSKAWKLGRGAGVVNYSSVRWLSAYRLKYVAKLTHNAARKQTDERKREVADSPEQICHLPDYPHGTDWSKYTDRARQLMDQLFAPPSGDYYRTGLPDFQLH